MTNLIQGGGGQGGGGGQEMGINSLLQAYVLFHKTYLAQSILPLTILLCCINHSVLKLKSNLNLLVERVCLPPTTMTPCSVGMLANVTLFHGAIFEQLFSF